MNSYSSNTNSHLVKLNFSNQVTGNSFLADSALGEINNLKKIILCENKREFKQFFCRLNLQNKQNEAAFLISQLLKDASREFTSNSAAPYLFIIKNINKIYPQISRFFTNPMVQNGLKIISPRGVEVIIRELKEKGSLKDMQSIVCCNFNELEIQMLKTIDEMKNHNSLNRCCFHVRCFGKYKKSRHIAPIYLEKMENGKFVSFLTDSVGANGISYVISSITNDILDKANINVTRYIYTGKARQKDETNCPVFSINDSLYFAKHSEKLKEWAKKYGQKDEGDDVFLDKLPPQMMKTTQFLSVMQQLEEEVGESIGLNFKHLRMSAKGKLFNAKAIHDYFKYERLIIEKVIKNECT